MLVRRYLLVVVVPSVKQNVGEELYKEKLIKIIKYISNNFNENLQSYVLGSVNLLADIARTFTMASYHSHPCTLPIPL